MTDLVNPLSEGIVEAENATTKRDSLQPKVCLNCGTALTDAYCSHCGQKDIPRRQTLGDMLMNFFSSFSGFEGKFFKTSKLTLFRPGQLSKDYNEGKRERYFHPARMYVFVSFLYFLLIAVLPDPPGDSSSASTTTADSTNTGGFKFDSTLDSFKSASEYDSIQQTLPARERDGKVMTFLHHRLAKLNEKYHDDGQRFNTDFSEVFIENTPRVFFLLLPIFALLLHALYFRRDYYYSEHLVFAVVFYNFFFLTGSIYMLLKHVPFVNVLAFLLLLWVPVYLLIAMKVMYHQSWRKTILKYSILLFIFTFCIFLGLAGNAFFTLMFI